MPPEKQCDQSLSLLPLPPSPPPGSNAGVLCVEDEKRRTMGDGIRECHRKTIAFLPRTELTYYRLGGTMHADSTGTKSHPQEIDTQGLLGFVEFLLFSLRAKIVNWERSSPSGLEMGKSPRESLKR